MHWNDWIIGHEITIRLAFFAGVFATVAGWEFSAPRRALTVSRPRRWGNNLALALLNSLVLRLLFPAAAAGVAFMGEQRGWGLMEIRTLPFPLSAVATVVCMDLAIYLQHVAFHAVPVLWRLHRVHHADPDIDVTTGTRFHPLEIILSMLIKCVVILALGAPAAAVVIFEVLLNATAMFNHGNIKLPPRIDRILRLLIVTPDMHRVHHSTEGAETDSNYGFSLPWWDRLFGTYVAQPRAGHAGMQIGLRGLREPARVTRLGGMLLLPFRADKPAHGRGNAGG